MPSQAIKSTQVREFDRQLGLILEGCKAPFLRFRMLYESNSGLVTALSGLSVPIVIASLVLLTSMIWIALLRHLNTHFAILLAPWLILAIFFGMTVIVTTTKWEQWFPRTEFLVGAGVARHQAKSRMWRTFIWPIFIGLFVNCIWAIIALTIAVWSRLFLRP
jgi:hypothetical protein